MLNRFVKRPVRYVAQRVGDWYEQRHNEDLAIALALTTNQASPKVHYPGSYAEFLRECIRPQRHHVKEIRSTRTSMTTAAKRFELLVNTLSTKVPPLALSIAQEIGYVADKLQATTRTQVHDTAIGDVGLNFDISSSPARAGRLISCIVRLMQSDQCLELGTAFGLSALFTLAALRGNGDSGHLTTLEGEEPQFSLAKGILQENYANRVSCRKGLTYDVLPGIVSTLGMIDFLFHDAGHSRKDYIDDFALVEPILARGSVMLIDDINWSDSRYYKGDPQTYAGWRAIVKHKRVERAVEIDNSRGLILLN